MEENIEGCLQKISEANPIQKKVPVHPKSIIPLLPLPDFRNSESIVELAPTFNTKQQKEVHILPLTKFSELFRQPLYQSTKAFNLNAPNLNFSCLKAFYSESASYPPPTEKNPQEKDELQFESRFESGNLAFASKAESPGQYNLLLQKDINSTKCTQWFFFRVKNNEVTGRIRFNILNFFKSYSSYQNGMKIMIATESSKYSWTRACEDIIYMKNNVSIGRNKTHYTLSFVYDFKTPNQTVYFAHSQPYTFTMLDKYLLKLNNKPENSQILKRRTLTQSPGGNYVDLLTITNFNIKKQKKVVFITSRVHPGQSPSSFVCQGLINYLLSQNEEVKQLRDEFIFKIVPMLNPDGVINGSYRCSLSGYDLNRVWHYDNKISSPEIYYTKKAIISLGEIFMFIDLHAHSKKKGVFMYGCQNKMCPYLSRHIPYLFWKEISHFNYYQCNFAMRLGRQGTSRLHINKVMNLVFSYTMEHSFCGPIKEKHHFTIKHYRDIGAGIAKTLKKYYCMREEHEIFQELENNKELLQVGNGSAESSDDSELDEPIKFSEVKEVRVMRRKPSGNFKSKMISSSNDSVKNLQTKPSKKDTSLQRQSLYSNFDHQAFLTRNYPQRLKEPYSVAQIFISNADKSQELMGEQVVLTGRFSELDKRMQEDRFQCQSQRSSSRYQCNEIDSLNNLFLPSLTSASYKRYAKKKNYPKPFIQVGKNYLQSRGILKEEIRSVSRPKKHGWKDRAISFL